MSATVVVLVTILLQQGLFTLAWGVLAAMRLSRRAALQWALATALISASLLLVVLRDDVAPWLGYWLAPMLTLAAFALIRRGVLEFVRRPPGDGEQMALVLAVALALAAALAWGQPWMLITLGSAAFGYLLLRTAWTVWHGLGGEMGRAATLACVAPIALIGAVFLLRAFVAAVRPEVLGGSLHAATALNLGMVLGFLVAGMLLNFGLLGLVVSRLLLRLQHHSEHDGLTGLLNRRAIEQRLASEAERLARYHQPYGVLSIDIDHFTTINDRFGHPAGDAVLRALGQTLLSVGRATDQVARTGGEEFWLVMPSTGRDGAVQLAERLLHEVRAMRVPGPRGEITLSVSIGVAVAEHSGEPADHLLQRLDAALYRAKQAGRDRIEMAAASAQGPSAEPGAAG